MTAKCIHITIPEELLTDIDREAKARYLNRSAYFKWLHLDYLRRERESGTVEILEPQPK